MKKAIVIGATSGIGMQLAIQLDAQGYRVGATGRRYELLQELSESLTQPAVIRAMDITNQSAAMGTLSNMIDDMAGCDLIVLNAGTGNVNHNLEWELDKQTIETNVSGFVALAGVAFRYFREQQSGHLVGISSITSIRGGPVCSYNASKAFISSYMQGMRFLIARKKLNITITDIKPGFVDTDLAKGNTFWMSQPERAAADIVTAINKKKKLAYITPRWRLIAWLFRILPDFLYHRI